MFACQWFQLNKSHFKLKIMIISPKMDKKSFCLLSRPGNLRIKDALRFPGWETQNSRVLRVKKNRPNFSGSEKNVILGSRECKSNSINVYVYVYVFARTRCLPNLSVVKGTRRLYVEIQHTPARVKINKNDENQLWPSNLEVSEQFSRSLAVHSRNERDAGLPARCQQRQEAEGGRRLFHGRGRQGKPCHQK